MIYEFNPRSPFGSQSMFGQMDGGIANPFNSSHFNSFGGTSTSESVFGQTSVPTFGSSSSSSSSPLSCSFGQKMGSFGGFGLSSNQPNPFTSTGSSFSASNSPAFGASSGFAFGASCSPGPGTSSSFSFGTSSAPAFGASSSSAFIFGSTPASSSPFSFGAQTGLSDGNKNEAYKWTPHDEQSNAKMEPISAMPTFSGSSHKDMKLADYQHSEKGELSAPTSGSGFQKANLSSPFGAASFGQTASNPNFFSFTSQSAQNASPFSSFSKSNVNLYSSVKQSNSNPFSMNQTNATSCCLASQSNLNKTQSLNSFPFSFTSQSMENQNSSPFCFTSKTKQNQNLNPFSCYQQSNPNSNANSLSFNSQSNQNENPFSSFAKGLNQNPSSSPYVAKPSPIFSSSSTSSSTSSIFGSVTTQAMGTSASSSNANTTQATGLSPFSTPDFGQQPSNGSWYASPPFGQATTPPTMASASVSTPSSSQAQAMTRNQTPSLFAFGENDDNQASEGGTGPSASSQQVGSQTVMATPAAPSENLFDALPSSAPQMSVGLCCTISSVQYGISCLSVGDRAVPSRGSLSVPRHFSQRRVRLPLRRHHTKSEAPEVAFYAQRQEAFYAPKLDAFVIPRQNPRDVTVSDPTIVNKNKDDWLGDEICDKLPKHLEHHLPVPNLPTSQNDDLLSSGEQSDSTASPSFEQEDDQDDCDLNLDENDENAPPPSTVDCNHSTQKGLQAAIVYEHGAEIEALMPKLRHADYYTVPRIQDLAARERADPGFCSRVPGFLVGRTGYGCIKFLGETDVRKLDLEAIVQFSKKEVVVYRDEKKKPVVGQGLNKPAEVTLLNIKCINKKTGECYLTGPKVERYKQMLAKKTAEQGGEFLSFDPVKEEWRFKVKHFSRYGLL